MDVTADQDKIVLDASALMGFDRLAAGSAIEEVGIETAALGRVHSKAAAEVPEEPAALSRLHSKVGPEVPDERATLGRLHSKAAEVPDTD